ncbi:MAG: YkgJ family cysteine cluster protein, partial [Deltaproteobacteria bacterium]|nr:YkgJ family cysteine cluster protein [Deltaproteobacteria bacterium]
DHVFERVKSDFPVEVTCKIECSDCCHALFDISLVEALYLNYHFKRVFSDKQQAALRDKANTADRIIYKIKRNARKHLESGQDEDAIVRALSVERIRCPLLNDQSKCDLYDHRPVTCRLYGVPTEIGGLAHTCGKSGFIKGKTYPTVHLDKLNAQLYALADSLVASISSKYDKLAQVVVPVSSAMLTVYNDDYLGTGTDSDGANDETSEKGEIDE